MFADVGPHCEQYALAFVVTSTVLMGLAEIAHHDRAVDRAHNLGQGYLLGRAGQNVTTADAALRANKAGSFEGEQDLFQVGLWKNGAIRDVSDRRWGSIGVNGERKQRPACVVTTG